MSALLNLKGSKLSLYFEDEQLEQQQDVSHLQSHDKQMIVIVQCFILRQRIELA